MEKVKQIGDIHQSKYDEMMAQREQHEATVRDQIHSLQSQFNANVEQLEADLAAAREAAAKQEGLVKEREAQMAQLRRKHEKLQGANDQQTKLLESSQENIKQMVVKEENMIADINARMKEFQDKQDKLKQKLKSTNDEKEEQKMKCSLYAAEMNSLQVQLEKKDERVKELTEELRVRFAEKVNEETSRLRATLRQKELELAEAIQQLSVSHDEKRALHGEVQKLARENDFLVGHQNPSQKIQHHLKIKEENNRLRQENYNL